MTTSMTSELTLIDTNVLVYSADRDSSHFAASRAVLELARIAPPRYCITPQTLAEFYSITTNPKRVTHPRSSQDAATFINHLLQLPGLIMLPVPVDIVTRWLALVQARPVKGQRIFDLQMAATMRANGVSKILTFNADDFKNIPGIEVVVPSTIVEPS